MEANTAELDFKLANTLRDMKVSGAFALRDTMRVMTNNMIQFSFPKNAAEGKGAIDKDLNKVFNTLDNPDVIAYFNSRFGDGSASQSGKLKGKKRKQTIRREMPEVKFNWDGNPSRMKAWHESHKRKGKVVAKSRKVASKGNFDFYSGMYVPATALKRYARGVYQSIAKYKAGWVAGADALAALTGGRITVPAFVRKQPDKRGSYEEWKDSQGDLGISVWNRIPYASKLGEYVIERARLRTVAYSQKATKKQAEDIARRFNERNKGGGLVTA